MNSKSFQYQISERLLLGFDTPCTPGGVRRMKIHAKIDPKSEHKIDLWAIRGPTFEVLGRFLRGLIFDEFSIGKKSAKNPTFGV